MSFPQYANMKVWISGNNCRLPPTCRLSLDSNDTTKLNA